VALPGVTQPGSERHAISNVPRQDQRSEQASSRNGLTAVGHQPQARLVPCPGPIRPVPR